ncbi:MAG: cytochrome c [Candidatus Rokubacteria bacterium]|nr:cytochrome c [Candidatus Rokubacteria bacterium]
MRRLPLAILATLALAGCEQPQLSPSAERGRQIYLAQCVSCHGPDPAQAGPIGPRITGSSKALLEAKVVSGTYPPGYTPKRPTKVMMPLPALAPDIPALADYLR